MPECISKGPFITPFHSSILTLIPSRFWPSQHCYDSSRQSLRKNYAITTMLNNYANNYAIHAFDY